MPLAFLTPELHTEAAQSVKDRRQVVRSLKDRLRTSFNVSVAELDGAELWNRATVGVVSVSHSRDYLDGLIRNVERAAARIANNHVAEIAASFVEYYYLPAGSLWFFAAACGFDVFCNISNLLLPPYLPQPEK